MATEALGVWRLAASALRDVLFKNSLKVSPDLRRFAP